jgi:tetratricopeptide (TPR) repeat protein
MVGRNRETDVLLAGLPAAQGGRGSAVALVGEAGIGKSRLANELANYARGQIPVLLGRSVGDGLPQAYRALAEALQAGLRAIDPPPDLAELMPFRPALGRLLPQFRTDNVIADNSLAVLAEAVLRLLRTLASGTGLLLILEDLHWADPETLAVVEYLADNIAATRLLIVLTTRDEPGVARSMLRRLADRGAVNVLDLEPLDDAAVTEMAGACLGEALDARAMAALQHRAQGVPLVVEELLTTPASEGAPDIVPTSIAEMTRARLRELPDIARTCVQAAAALGERFDWRLLPAALDCDEAAVLDALRVAISAQLIHVDARRDFAFRHVLTRDAVLADLLPPERARMAERTLRALEAAYPQLDGPRLGLAAWLATLVGDRDRAARLLLTASRNDLASGALATAELTLRRAHELADDPTLRMDIAELLAEVLLLAGHPDGVAQVTHALVNCRDGSAADPARLARSHLRLARAWTVAGAWPAATEQIQRARELAGADPQLHALVDAADALLSAGRDDFARAESFGRAALQTAERAGPAEVVCEALEVLGRCARRRDLLEAEQLFEQAARFAEGHQLPVWHVRALHELATIDAFESLRLDRFQRARDAALRAGALGVAAHVDSATAGVHIVRGEASAAIQVAQRCLDSARQLGLPIVPITLVFQAEAHDLRGEAGIAEDRLREALALAPDDSVMAAEAWHARATRCLLAGDSRRALAALDQAMTFVRRDSNAITPAMGRWMLMATLARGHEPLRTAIAMSRGHLARWTRAHLQFANAVVHGREGSPRRRRGQLRQCRQRHDRPRADAALPPHRALACR